MVTNQKMDIWPDFKMRDDISIGLLFDKIVHVERYDTLGYEDLDGEDDSDSCSACYSSGWIH